MTTRAPGLALLLGELPLDDFLAEFYETKALFVKAPSTDSDWPGLGDVESMLNAAGGGKESGERMVRTEPDGSLTEQRVPRLGSGSADVQAVYRGYADGFTLVVNQVNRRDPRVASYCRAIQAELGHPVAANLYLTPIHSQGFLAHADSHDVFIVQLHGSKTWQIAAPTTELPLPNRNGGRELLPDAHTYVLTVGDVLYLPRGFRHAAATGDGSSMHLTIGVDAFRWRDLFADMLDIVAESDVAFRMALPTTYFEDALASDQVGERVSRLVSAFADADVIDQARQRLRSRLVATTTTVGLSHLVSLDAVQTLTIDSILIRDPSVACIVGSSGAGARIEFLGNYVTGPSSIAPALDFIANHHRFHVARLPGEISAQDRLDLVGRLVTEGLLEVDNHEQ